MRQALILSLFAVLIIGMPPTARAENDRHPAEITQVTAEGEVAADETNAREKAIADALRNAVMAEIGVYVDATTIGEDYQVIKDDILMRASGFATLDEMISTSVKDGILKVKIKASVTNRPLAEKLKALGLLHEWKVGVVIAESYLTGRKPVADPAAAAEIIRQLIKTGYRVMDESRTKKLRDDELASRAASGDPEALRAIKREFDVDIFITGEAFAEYVDEADEGGVKFYRTRGRIEAKAYYTDTGEIVTITDAFADGLDQTENLAARKCLKQAGLRIAETLARDIMIAPAALTPFVTVKITGFKSATSASGFESELEKLSGISRVKRQRYSDGALELNVYIKTEYRDDLPEKIESSSVGRKLGVIIDIWSKTFVQGRVTKEKSSRAKYHKN